MPRNTIVAARQCCNTGNVPLYAWHRLTGFGGETP
jgi:hypothetical protein